ncbi:MAG TPA: PilX N-terminal domain-containing pilus assembly protein [Myxococcota bacterium]|jgi:hypothetical protein|nr:PilX N-terminal domain-containing pilus assembly protein [Myxococcota bacterium]
MTPHLLLRTHPPRAEQRARASERGSALIISLLLLIVVTTAGLVALRGAKGELSVAGSHRLARTTVYIAEAGLSSAISRVGGAFQEYLTIAKLNNNGVIYLDDSTLPVSLFAEDGEAGGSSLGKLAAAPGVAVRAYDAKDDNEVAGFSSHFHFKKMTFESTGRIDLDAPVPGAGTTVRMRAHAKLGPVQD